MQIEIYEQSVEFVRGTPEPERLIEEAGRTSYQSWDRAHAGSEVNFVRMLRKLGHLSVFEHACATMRFITNRGMCYDEGTEVLTRRGWLPFSQVTKESELACLSDCGELEWHHPLSLQSYPYVGDLLAFETSSFDLLVTPNHQMWVFDYDKRASDTRVWKFVRADSLTNNHYGFTKTASWKGVPQTAVIPAHSWDHKKFPTIRLSSHGVCSLYELLGLWAADGSYRYGAPSGGGSSVFISQIKPAGRKRIAELCRYLGLKCAWCSKGARIDNLRFLVYVESLFGPGAKTFSVRVPECIKEATPDQIQCFLDGVMMGDGSTHKKSGHRVIYTSSKGFADDLQELWLKVGLSANIRSIRARVRGSIQGVEVKSVRDSWVVSVHEKKKSRPLLFKKSARKFAEKIAYSGRVYCATVPYHRLYVRRNGKAVWCGNSHEVVRHRIGSFTQESTRYCAYRDRVRFIRPYGVRMFTPGKHDSSDSSPGVLFRKALQDSANVYKDLLDMGQPAQVARDVLPNALATEIVVTFNLRQWLYVLGIRGINPKAHPQMRQLIALAEENLIEYAPTVFEEFATPERQAAREALFSEEFPK